MPRSTQNGDQLLDDQAQALLWLYICTLESKLEKVGGGCGMPKWIQVQIWKCPGALCMCQALSSALLAMLSSAPGPPRATQTLLESLLVSPNMLPSLPLQNIEREQRAKAQGLRNTDDFEPNDLNYEGRLLEEEFLYDGISFNLETETGEDSGGFGPFVKRLCLEAPGLRSGCLRPVVCPQLCPNTWMMPLPCGSSSWQHQASQLCAALSRL